MNYLPGKVHPHGELPVAPELVKPVGPEGDGNQGNVAVVHGLRTKQKEGTLHRYNYKKRTSLTHFNV